MIGTIFINGSKLMYSNDKFESRTIANITHATALDNKEKSHFLNFSGTGASGRIEKITIHAKSFWKDYDSNNKKELFSLLQEIMMYNMPYTTNFEQKLENFQYKIEGARIEGEYNV